MLCIEMSNRNPLQRNSQISLRYTHQIARQLHQIDPLTEFRRDDDFPKPLISCRLPGVQSAGYVDAVLIRVESGSRRFSGCALPCNITAMGTPLAPHSVARVGHTDG